MEFLLPNAFNAEHTRMIKEAVNIPVFIGHNIFTPEEGEKMLAEGNGDFVALGRSQLADPAWAKKAREGHANDIKPCINCMIGCIDKGMLGHTPIRCTVNPSLYRFECEPVVKAEVQKKVAVVGAAGCEAALTAAMRGHQVTIYEKRAFGGAMIEASKPENKANIRRLIRYYEEHISCHPNITLVRENADYETLVNGGYDAAIIAVGGKTRILNVPGIALELVAENKKVTVVEMSDAFLANPSSSCQAYNVAIAKTDIQILTGKRLTAIQKDQVVLMDRWGNEMTLKADSVVIAAGFISNNELADQLEENTEMEVFNIGDSKRVRQIYDAIHEGFIAARQI